VPEDPNSVKNFASSPTRQNGFVAPMPPPGLWEPSFHEVVDSVEADKVDVEPAETAALLAAVSDPMPLGLVMVRSVPWQLQKVEWAVAELDGEGKVELHGRDTIWEPELVAEDVASTVEAFDQGQPVSVDLELRAQERPRPVKHLVATVESRGIVVAVRPLSEIDAVDAFSVVVLDRPIIITTPRRTENVFKHRFSNAHEIGHLLLHREVTEPTATIEKEADAFAAAFLTPASAMDTALPQRLDLAALDCLGRTWGVSPTSLVRRMVERGRTTESSARRAYQRLNTVYDSKADPAGAYPGEVPTLLKKAAALAGDNDAPIPVLAEALKVNPALIRDLLGEADQRPALRLVVG
jgi:Zn-dependent peptidase ImmA (M78 family)